MEKKYSQVGKAEGRKDKKGLEDVLGKAADDD